MPNVSGGFLRLGWQGQFFARPRKTIPSIPMSLLPVGAQARTHNLQLAALSVSQNLAEP